jgi:hypothetical protein
MKITLFFYKDITMSFKFNEANLRKIKQIKKEFKYQLKKEQIDSKIGRLKEKDHLEEIKTTPETFIAYKDLKTKYGREIGKNKFYKELTTYLYHYQDNKNEDTLKAIIYLFTDTLKEDLNLNII